MTKPLPDHLKSKIPDHPYKCEVCKGHRGHGDHSKCSRIRQDRHAQVLRDEAFDNLLMDDKKGRR